MSSGKKYGRFVTIDDRVVFIGGPGSGAGGTSAVSANSVPVPAVYQEGTSGPESMRMAETYLEGGSLEGEDPLDEIAAAAGVDPEFVYKVSRDWEYFSNREGSLVVQQEASKLFGTDLTDFQKKRVQEQDMSRISEEYRGKVRDTLKAMYDRTQRELEEAGFPEVVTLRRGVKLPGDVPGVGSVIQVYENALSSFSANGNVASNFAGSAYNPGNSKGVVIEMQVPRSRIFSTGRTGMGNATELEFVVIGNNSGQGDEVKIVEVK